MSKTWDVQRDHVSLIRDALGCLTRGGKIYFSNNLRSFKLDTEALQDMGFAVEDITAATIPEDYIRNPKIHHCWILTLEK
jgi:23S rRNA (guanine2445-N2)-methyltransferase / 23S rRNA (guanine2069-N7)-methyltransferase